jgi:cell wall-associated NlpC family hydrolase
LAPRTLAGLRRAVLAVTIPALAVTVSAILAPAPAHADPSLGALAQQVEQQGRELDVVMEQYNQVNVQLGRTQAQLADVSAKIPQLTAQVDRASAAVSTLANHAYRGSQISGLGAVLNAGSPAELIDRLDTMDVLARSQHRDIAAVTAARGRLQDEKARLDGLVARQSAQESDLAARKARIETQIASLKKQQDDLKRKQEEQDRIAAAQAAAQAQAAAAAAAAAAAKAKQPPPPAAAPAPPRNPGPAQKPPPVSGKVGAVLAYAYAQLGRPYVFGAAGPKAFDCSGIVLMAWRQAGVFMDHSSYIMMNEQTVHVSVSQMRPGDLVFFHGGGHVGLFVGNGNVLHAPHTGDVVKISPLSWMGSITAVGRPRGA